MHTPLSVLLKFKGNKVLSVSPSHSLQDCALLMKEHNVGAVVVVEAGKVVGMFTERDVVNRVISDDVSRTSPVSDVMTKNVTTVTSDSLVDDAMGIMTRDRHRHLPVVDDGELVGILSIGDILRSVLETQSTHIQQLKGYIDGS